MQVKVVINGSIRFELQRENTDDDHVLALLKDKTVSKITVNGKGDGELTGVVFEMVRA